jgi:hypothetical protein
VQLRHDSLLFSASDLNHFIECEHLAWLERERALGRLERPDEVDPTAELVARKGHEHEAGLVQALRDGGRAITTIAPPHGDLEAGAHVTAEAMRAGAEVVYQGVLLGDGWLGIADFLFRVERQARAARPALLPAAALRLLRAGGSPAGQRPRAHARRPRHA